MRAGESGGEALGSEGPARQARPEGPRSACAHALLPTSPEGERTLRRFIFRLSWNEK